MSNLAEQAIEGDAEASSHVLLPREVPLGGPRAMLVRRTLPHRSRRMIGPWCFVDHYGPVAESSMDVPPHPHTGLQTVSWLLAGTIDHVDSVGSKQLIKPGQLNLMTSGRAIAHAETSHAGDLHGIQLWIALPESARHQEPHFEHHAELPRLSLDGAVAIVMMGSLADVTSPATIYSPLVGAEITMLENQCTLPLSEGFEYGLLALDNEATISGVKVPRYSLFDMGGGRTSATISAKQGSKFLLIGGEHFDEEIVMWWNFIGRSHEEIVAMRQAWEAQEGYQPVDIDEERLPAPELPISRLKPRGA